MARIDRRVSPNQTALWTIYELISIQARRVVAAASTDDQNHDGIVVRFLSSLLAAAARAGLRVVRRVRALAALTSTKRRGTRPVAVP
jgi:hypothetical protein